MANPIIIRVDPPKRQRDWRGHRVRAAQDIYTGTTMIPVGRVGTVDHTSHGIATVTFDGCACCGVGARLRWKIYQSKDLVEFVEEKPNG